MQTNPNGANGTTSDPREQKMWDGYVTKLLNGVENAYQSAIEAGYEDATARQITVRSWFLERKARLKRKDMFSKSEKVLDKTLDMVTLNDKGFEDPQLLKIQVDVAKTIVSTLGKEEGYSTRSEVTGKDGKDLFIKEEEKALIDNAFNNI